MVSLKRFRLVAFLEGLSYLTLLFIAMPLKYMADMPLAVRVTGSLHGILFVAFVVLLAQVTVERGWSLLRAAAAFVSSIVPFGAFALDRHLRREIDLGEP